MTCNLYSVTTINVVEKKTWLSQRRKDAKNMDGTSTSLTSPEASGLLTSNHCLGGATPFGLLRPCNLSIGDDYKYGSAEARLRLDEKLFLILTS